jgi:ABC-2 type transport system ATP-binding protein
MAEVSGRIEISGLSKTFGGTRAVDSLSFAVEPGSVTGFLGPNGAGKTTTLRMLLGLVTPDAGTATIGGKRYVELRRPNDVVGAVLESSSFHPGRSGRNHLRVYCTVNGYPDRRADEVLELVGLAAAGRRATRGYSMGMRQRLGLATALLGDPYVLILDEPANGLDPPGIAWLRGLLRTLADQGRTVLVSSHVLSEVQQTADRVVIINQGRLVREGSLADLSAGQRRTVFVRSPHAERLAAALRANAADVQVSDTYELHVVGLDAAEVGHIAFAEQVELHALETERNDLEQIFFALTGMAAEPAVGAGGVRE